MRVKIVKNKVAPPFRVAEFDMMHADGISYEGDILDLGMEKKFVARTGAWFRYGEMQLGQGKEKARDFLKEESRRSPRRSSKRSWPPAGWKTWSPARGRVPKATTTATPGDDF